MSFDAVSCTREVTRVAWELRTFCPFDVSPLAWTIRPLKIANDGENGEDDRGKLLGGWRRLEKKTVGCLLLPPSAFVVHENLSSRSSAVFGG